jgi:hypothetical protein
VRRRLRTLALATLVAVPAIYLGTAAGADPMPAEFPDARLKVTAHTPSLISGSPLLRAEDKTRKPNYRAVLQLAAGGDFDVDFTQGPAERVRDRQRS